MAQSLGLAKKIKKTCGFLTDPVIEMVENGFGRQPADVIVRCPAKIFGN